MDDSVFDIELDIYESISKPDVIGHITLKDLFDQIQYQNIGSPDRIDAYLTPKYIGGVKNKIYDKMKLKVECVCYNATFHNYKTLENVKSITNIMFLDIDDFQSKDAVEDYKKYITEKYDWIVACYKSLSGTGLHIVIKVDIIKNNGDFNKKYDYVSTTYFNGRLDNSAKSLTRNTVVPFDYYIYVNEYPNTLNIDEEYRKSIVGTFKGTIEYDNIIANKSIVGTYSADNRDINVFPHKSIVGNCNNNFNGGNISPNKKSIRGGEEEKTISTFYTFLCPNDQHVAVPYISGLLFKHFLSEDYFHDPNEPFIIPEGLDIIEIVLSPYRKNKVLDGHRTDFLGAISMQLIYLNAPFTSKANILNGLLRINRTFCNPPREDHRVISAFESNWKLYEAGELDVSKYMVRKRVFWSIHCTLTTNEKKSKGNIALYKTSTDATKQKIYDAIQTLMVNKIKITQESAAKESGFSRLTVRSYWDNYEDMVREHNRKIKEKNKKAVYHKIKPITQEIKTTSTQSININESNEESSVTNITEPITDTDTESESEDQDGFSLVEYLLKTREEPIDLTEDNLHIIYQRIYKSFRINLEEHLENEFFQLFVERFKSLPQDDQKLLATPYDKIKDYSTFWKQSTMDGKFWDMKADFFRAKT